MKKLFLSLILFFTPITAVASPCDQFFPNGKEIVVSNTTVLCSSFYASVFDTTHEEAIFSTQLFQPHSESVPRSNNFHADDRVDNSPTPADYDKTGFDRGHLTPAADAATATEMSDTFLMTNMTPQEPTVNRISWKELETKVRNMVNVKYVITGAIYVDGAKTIGKHHIPIPVSYYKIVYLSDGTTQTYVANNTPHAPVTISTLDAVEIASGIKFH